MPLLTVPSGSVISPIHQPSSISLVTVITSSTAIVSSSSPLASNSYMALTLLPPDEDDESFEYEPGDKLRVALLLTLDLTGFDLDTALEDRDVLARPSLLRESFEYDRVSSSESSASSRDVLESRVDLRETNGRLDVVV